ncbi:glycosyltransferase family 2 protein [Porticoccus sp.]
MVDQISNKVGTLAIVVPCYNESEIIGNTISILLAKLDALITKNLISPSSFLCLVDDGSEDMTWSLIEQGAALAKGNLRAVKLAGNVGHQKAMLAGMEYCNDKCDILLTTDADMQDDLSVLEDMLAEYCKGSEVVFGVRNDRSLDSWWKRNTASLFYYIIELMGVKTLKDHADFRLMSRKAVSSLSKFGESNIYIRGVCVAMGFTTSIVYYGRQARIGGSPKYSFSKMLSLGWDGVTSFSVFPLRLISLLGLFVFLGSLIVAARIVYASIYLDTTVPGWSSTVLPIFLLGGIQLLSLGVIGEYLAKTYIETKRRPRYLIDKVIVGVEGTHAE